MKRLLLAIAVAAGLLVAAPSQASAIAPLPALISIGTAVYLGETPLSDAAAANVPLDCAWASGNRANVANPFEMQFYGSIDCTGPVYLTGFTVLYAVDATTREASGTEFTCPACTSALSMGRYNTAPGSPHWLNFWSIVNLPPGWVWAQLPGGCTGLGTPMATCDFWDVVVHKGVL